MDCAGGARTVSYTHLDVYKRQAVKKDMLIIGEIWHYAGDFLEGDEWDTVMNYPFYLNMIDLLADKKITVSESIPVSYTHLVTDKYRTGRSAYLRIAQLFM